MSALEKLGEAARRARAYISPWNVFSPTDVASNLPGGGLASAAPFYGEGLKKTAEATKAFREGRFGDAARFYGSGVLDTATAGLSAAGDVAPMAKLAMTMVPAAKKAAGIRAFHGSPHDFDRFDMSKIGTGEGAQAYGHGLYFAENEKVAKGYRDTLSDGNIAVDGRPLVFDSPDSHHMAYRALKSPNGNSPEGALSYLSSIAPKNEAEGAAIKEAADLIAQGRAKLLDGGKMYEVRINADPDQFLDWDKPFHEQGQQVKDVISGLVDDPAGYIDTRTLIQNGLGWGSSSERVAATLREAGIPGIKYLDAGSRGSSFQVQPTYKGKPYGDPVNFGHRLDAQRYADEQIAKGFGADIQDAGTRNYVVFDDKLIEIIRKYGWAPGMAIPAAMALEMQQAQEQSAPQM